MFRRFRRAFVLLTVPVIVGLAVWIYQARLPRFPIQQTVLTNGTTLQLVSVQYGLSHADPFLPFWKQWASGFPDSWTRRVGLNLPRKIQSKGNHSILSVWLTASKASPTSGDPEYAVFVGDDDNNFAGPVHDVRSIVGWTPEIPYYEAHGFPIFPRRSRELRIRIYDDPPGRGRLLHEFRIPNPALVSTNEVPPFVPQPLPQSRTSGDLEATLESLEVRPTPVGMTLGDPTWHQTRLGFTLRQDGLPTTNWVAQRIHHLSDATGNEGQGIGSHGRTNGRAFLSFTRWALPPSEPWRMEVDFCRRHGFATNELWEVRRIPIATSTFALIPMTNRVSGTEVRITAFGDSPTDKLRHLGLRSVVLDVETGPPPDERRWHLTIVRAIDSTGLDVTSSQVVEFESNDQILVTYNVSTNATSLDLRFAYVPARTMEFTAQPTRYDPGDRPPQGSRTSPWQIMGIRLSRHSRVAAYLATEPGTSSSPQSSAALRCRESYEANAWHPASNAAATCQRSRLRVPKVAENLAERCSARMKTAARS